MPRPPAYPPAYPPAKLAQVLSGKHCDTPCPPECRPNRLPTSLPNPLPASSPTPTDLPTRLRACLPCRCKAGTGARGAVGRARGDQEALQRFLGNTPGPDAQVGNIVLGKM